jgi:hypothetical protein
VPNSAGTELAKLKAPANAADCQRFALQFKDCREGSSRQSCLCAIFAMLNSLKSWMGQNANSPFNAAAYSALRAAKRL